MAEENTSTETSGTPGDGGGSPAGYVPQAVFDRAEAQRRSLQSQLDQLRATPPAPAAPAAPEPTSTGTSTVESELAAIKATLAGFQGFDPAAVGKQVQAEIARAQAIADARTKLASEFSNARPEVLGADYATPEEMKAAVEASHTAETASIKAVEERVREELRAQMKELHGVDLAPAPQAPATSDASGDTGPATIRDLASMDFDKLTSMSDEDIAKALART